MVQENCGEDWDSQTDGPGTCPPIGISGALLPQASAFFTHHSPGLFTE